MMAQVIIGVCLGIVLIIALALFSLIHSLGELVDEVVVILRTRSKKSIKAELLLECLIENAKRGKIAIPTSVAAELRDMFADGRGA